MSKKYVTVLSRHPSHRQLRRKLLSKHRVVVRLGSTTEKKADIEINTVQAVVNSSDKFLMKKRFFEYQIPTCDTFYFQNGQLTDMKTGSIVDDPPVPIIAKHRFGSRGTGNYLLNTKQEVQAFIDRRENLNMFIFEKFFSGSREYRLHVSKNGCFCSWRKLRKADQQVRWFFNSQNSVFVGPDNPLFNKPDNWNEIEKTCVNALHAVGLDIGAIDLRISKKGEFKILETNSAPSLGEKGAMLYLHELNLIINE